MKLRLLVRNFLIPVTIAWGPVHCSIDCNERADELVDHGAVKEASRKAKTWLTLDPLITYLSTYCAVVRGGSHPCVLLLSELNKLPYSKKTNSFPRLVLPTSACRASRASSAHIAVT